MARVAGLTGKYLVLDRVLEQQTLASARATFFREGEFKPEFQARIRRYDISNASVPKAKSILDDNAGPGDPSVLVLWPSQRLAVSTQLSTFIDYYDDFWYPSSDDVWVVPSDLGWLLEISHEEIITLVRPDAETLSRQETIQ